MAEKNYLLLTGRFEININLTKNWAFPKNSGNLRWIRRCGTLRSHFWRVFWLTWLLQWTSFYTSSILLFTQSHSTQYTAVGLTFSPCYFSNDYKRVKKQRKQSKGESEYIERIKELRCCLELPKTLQPKRNET